MESETKDGINPGTFFKLNKDAKPFVPDFRKSKANLYRQLVANDCKNVKNNLLKKN
jgi:hypothetical protein